MSKYANEEELTNALFDIMDAVRRVRCTSLEGSRPEAITAQKNLWRTAQRIGRDVLPRTSKREEWFEEGVYW